MKEYFNIMLVYYLKFVFIIKSRENKNEKTFLIFHIEYLFFLFHYAFISLIDLLIVFGKYLLHMSRDLNMVDQSLNFF